MTEETITEALTDIRYNLRLIVEFTGNHTLTEFRTDYRTQYAVIRALEITGEASKRIPDSVRAEAASIPWKAMAGMRDRLIHAYDRVNVELVWETVASTVRWCSMPWNDSWRLATRSVGSNRSRTAHPAGRRDGMRHVP